MRYEMSSVIAAERRRAEDSARTLARALRLPPGSNPRALRARRGVALAVARATSEVVRARHRLPAPGALSAYTLEPPLLGSDSGRRIPVRHERGFCEHFSSAFVFLMRAAGMPARVVTGYQGGELNPVDHIITVRQSDAHAWAEVYLRGRGWVRVDPPPPRCPGASTRGSRARCRRPQRCRC